MARNSPFPGPYSATFKRGAAGHLDKRTAAGRFAAVLEAELVRHAAGPDATIATVPITQRLLIERIVKVTMQLNALDEKMAAGTWSETVLYLFSDPVIESQPGAMLTAGSNTLLGVTGYGGALFEGTVYELTY